ncbi:MAG TPA: glycosyltransferase, partial [Solirubrobacteraceae bacterium]|nr:glycosyltransferase [Solirubrobacteraceae bacterium]
MGADDRRRHELTCYLERLAEWCDDVIVVDGSPREVFSGNAWAWRGLVRHVAPNPARASLMGKVPGVLTGLELAEHERVVIADDDVRYGRPELERVVSLLADHDVVRPQNYFEPLPWHAVWDTARTLLNRALGADFPGTLGVRRSMLEASGGYDGDVLFENLELIRTVRAQGGRVVSPLDLYVRRLPPTADHFLGQRVRQAYDDFAIPVRMATWLSIVPLLATCAVRRACGPPAGLTLGTAAMAEYG